jgi:hypothetical protein
VIVLLLSRVASAQEEACPGLLTVAEIDRALDSVGSALASLDGDRAAHVLEELAEFTRCLGEVVPPDRIGRLAAQRSVVAYYEQDFEDARRWAQLALAVSGAADAGAVDGPQRWRDDYGALPLTPGAAAGAVAPPEGGLVTLDGRALLAPSAVTDTPHLLQVVDRKQRVLSSRWMDGTAFPEDVLGDGDPPEVPRWWVEPPAPSAPAAPASPEPAPAVSEPAPPAPEVVFDGEISTDGCPFSVDPQDVHARKKRVTIEGHTWTFREDLDLIEFRDVLRTCGEFRAARRFSRWQVQGGGALRDQFVQALRAPEPRRSRR